MNDSLLIKQAHIVNEGTITVADILVRKGHIDLIAPTISKPVRNEINADGLHLMPGIIDDQVHFREPGLTHKADIYSESRAAAAGGITSFMEMPNTNPPTLTQQLLEEKYQIAQHKSLVNYSFFMGASNDNLHEVLRTNPKNVCGIKIFMGSSTGNMLVDNPQVLDNLFAQVPMLIATHCEDEATIRQNMQDFRQQYNDQIPPACHPLIRSVEGCYLSSSAAVALAQKHNTRLHILHISTADELTLFSNTTPLPQKRITAEVCVHHLSFTDRDYATQGNDIKCNPAIKAPHHRQALWEALKNGTLDIVATDHAPHTRAEKNQPYLSAPSGIPLVQHSFQLMLRQYHEGNITLPFIVEKMCHAPAQCFRITNRGYIREGYHADMVLFQPHQPYRVTPQNILYRCGWSPLEGQILQGTITHTFVNGVPVFQQGSIASGNTPAQRLLFD
jgi:dihydroorotase